MIDPKELRIGNWIGRKKNPEKYYSDLHFERVIKICNNEIQVDGKSDLYKSDHLAGLQLTDEILEKCALTVNEYWESTHMVNAIKIDEKGLKYLGIFRTNMGDHVATLYTYTQNLNSDPPEGDQCEQISLDIDVAYLHQLQNLFFALTGNELEYKP